MTDQSLKPIRNLCSGVIYFCRTSVLKVQAFSAAKVSQRFSDFPLQGFNLLPYRHVHALRCRAWRRSQFALATCTGLLIAGVVQYHQSSSANQVAQDEKNLQRQLRDLQPQLFESQRLNALIATQQNRSKALASLTPARLALTTTLNALAQFKETSVSVTQLKIEPSVHTILGIASDYTALSRWVQFLKKTAHFANVEVIQVQHRIPTNAQAYAITPVGLTFSVHLSADSSSRANHYLSDLSKTPKRMPVTQPKQTFSRAS